MDFSASDFVLVLKLSSTALVLSRGRGRSWSGRFGGDLARAGVPCPFLTGDRDLDRRRGRSSTQD